MSGKMFMKKAIPALSALLLCGALAGCGGGLSLPERTPAPAVFQQGEVQHDVTELSIVLQSGETALLDALPALRSADLSGSENLEEIAAWAAAHPEVSVRYTVPLPTGETVASDIQELDLSGLTGQTAGDIARLLPLLPELTLVRLGEERESLSWEDIRLLTEACPQADFDYGFSLYGLSFRLTDTRIDLNHVPVDDGGAQALAAASCMPALSVLDMDSCGVSNEEMAAIRDALPDVKVIWRVWFGDAYSVRTDTERILASMPSKGGMLYPGNCEALKYCTAVKYLDVGHNDNLSDIGFVAYMPKLEVAILAMAEWSDATPLASCPELEYLELQTTNLKDLSPLSGLTKLKHLNICYCRDVEDISPLYALSQLERLWIGAYDPVPQEQIERMQAAAPECEINTTTDDPTTGRWRYVDYIEVAYLFVEHPRYTELLEQFDHYEGEAYSFWWNDPMY